MEKLGFMKQLFSRAISCRSLLVHSSSRSALNKAPLLSPRAISTSPIRVSSRTEDYRIPLGMGISSRRSFSADVSQLPIITDLDVQNAFKDLLATSWDELPDAAVHDAKKALSKATEDKAGQEALANVFRAAEAVEQFSGVLVSLRMELDDATGLSGENVRPMPDDLVEALRAVYRRYTVYLDAFGPDEVYLRKKVETELGTKMIHIKMRCSGIGSEWGKITVLGTSGLSGSYVEQRGP
eukprot:TRINITY_DN26728_c0_g1_i1.p1 TRINITY_DN26728_c0_g1~~TRINITY_DN26728_c0_g1_i1.p1  ORF type:complete len:239 (+),score=40.79 TRINITY_DN26728_c0_g1_i1:90-806(+)